jgi:two-component system cell cycle response regulator
VQGTILVIDGVSTNRIMLKVQLAAAYYDAVQAGSVAEVLQAARNCRPDLVLTAMSLPDGTAADVKRTLAADESLADLPVIAVSDWEGHQARLQALAAGIDDVLQQPVDDVILQARIRSLLRARSASEELNLQRDASQGFILPLCWRREPAQCLRCPGGRGPAHRHGLARPPVLQPALCASQPRHQRHSGPDAGAGGRCHHH